MPETNTIHTPINLAPGIDLMVRAGFENDDVTRDLVERSKAAIRRGEHVAAIKRYLDRMLQLAYENVQYTWQLHCTDGSVVDDTRDVVWCIAAAFELTGFFLNNRMLEIGIVAKALIALCGVVDDDIVSEVRESLEMHLEKLEAAS